MQKIVKLSRMGMGVLLALCGPAQAASKSSHGFLITVDPIIGYEFQHRTEPNARRKGMLIYGARVTAGRPNIAAEGEYTRGSDIEAFTSPSIQTVTTTKENVRLGVRTSHEFSKFLSLYSRLGGQASRTQFETQAPSLASTVSDGKWEIRPYTGLGLQGSVLTKISVGLEVNYVFRNFKDWSQNTTQYAGSIRVQL